MIQRQAARSATVIGVKRMMDVAVGLCGTAAFLTAYPLLAVLIKLESPGPVLYLQPRVGRDKRSIRERIEPTEERRRTDVGGRVFTIYKFRSMRLDAESNGPQLCGKGGDPRVTRLGAWLRSLHLDELPQFWNVLKGEMSFIGPRPERPHFTVQYAARIPAFRERTRGLKPGITGLAQITLGYDDSLESVARKTHFDVGYRSSMARFASWAKLEAWILLNTFVYLGKRRPLAEAVPAVAARIAHVTPTIAAPIRSAAKADSATVAAPAAKSTSNFLTIDVECGFHAHNLGIPRSAWERQPTRLVEDMRRILDILAVRDTKATFFTLGWVADRFPEVVRMIDAGGHEIGTHGYYHEMVTNLTPYQFEKDLDLSLNALAKRTSQKIIGHRASNFSIVEKTLWALPILARYGIEYDTSIFPIRRARYGIPDYPNRMPHRIDLPGGASMTEIPMSTFNVGPKPIPISGGGYLRLYPHAFTELFIRRRNAKGLPAMVYFHPWELDADQARIKAGLLKSFQHYVNLDTTAWKIDKLLERFRFDSIRTNLQSAPIRALLEKDSVTLGAQGIHCEAERPVSGAWPQATIFHSQVRSACTAFPSNSFSSA